MAIGTAKLMPAKSSTPAGLAIPVTIPTTWPWRLTSGPPEFPGLTAASNWISPVRVRPVADLERAVEARDHAGGEAVDQAQRVADREDLVADLNAAAEHGGYDDGRADAGA